MDKFKLQSAEFDAVDELMRKLTAHNQTAIVDDDYPMVRHEYESALTNFLRKMFLK